MIPHLTIEDLDILRNVYYGWDTASLEIVLKGGALDKGDGMRIILVEEELERRKGEL